MKKYIGQTIDRNISTRICLFIFVLCSILSYLYVCIYGSYNGDFLGKPSSLKNNILLLNLLITILPFFAVYYVFHWCVRIPVKHKISIPVKEFGVFLFFFLIFKVITTKIYAVGVLSEDLYSAPLWILPFIKISNKIDPVFGVCIYSLVVSKKSKLLPILYILILFISILQHSIFVLFTFFVLYIIKHSKNLSLIIKKQFPILLLLLLFSPKIVGSIYSYRSELRGEADITAAIKMSGPILLHGKLIGRLSSFSDSAIIIEDKTTITRIVKEHFFTFMYPIESLSVFIGGPFEKWNYSYPRIVLQSQGYYNKKVTYFLGIQGALMVGLYYSPLAFLVNIITIFFFWFIVFRIIMLLPYEGLPEIIFFFILTGVMSGLSVNPMGLFMNIFCCIIVFLIINCLKKNIKFNFYYK
ncbi:hypothetical protein AGMMS49546_23090 [Spirochaetia bacterium]|nr:hypothetical protein AGMMS49546_23090 [Spirochaetia bacterium]